MLFLRPVADAISVLLPARKILSAMTVFGTHLLIFAWVSAHFAEPAVRPVLNVPKSLQTLQLLTVEILHGISLPILPINVLPAAGLCAAPVKKSVRTGLFLLSSRQAALPSLQ
jgi:predicted PurR-regulated permease PerM